MNTFACISYCKNSYFQTLLQEDNQDIPIYKLFIGENNKDVFPPGAVFHLCFFACLSLIYKWMRYHMELMPNWI